jgi:hypothetical protein
MNYFNKIENYVDNYFNAKWLSYILDKNAIIKGYEIATQYPLIKETEINEEINNLKNMSFNEICEKYKL